MEIIVLKWSSSPSNRPAVEPPLIVPIMQRNTVSVGLSGKLAGIRRISTSTGHTPQTRPGNWSSNQNVSVRGLFTESFTRFCCYSMSLSKPGTSVINAVSSEYIIWGSKNIILHWSITKKTKLKLHAKILKNRLEALIIWSRNECIYHIFFHSSTKSPRRPLPLSMHSLLSHALGLDVWCDRLEHGRRQRQVEESVGRAASLQCRDRLVEGAERSRIIIAAGHVLVHLPEGLVPLLVLRTHLRRRTGRGVTGGDTVYGLMTHGWGGTGQCYRFGVFTSGDTLTTRTYDKYNSLIWCAQLSVKMITNTPICGRIRTISFFQVITKWRPHEICKLLPTLSAQNQSGQKVTYSESQSAGIL